MVGKNNPDSYRKAKLRRDDGIGAINLNELPTMWLRNWEFGIRN